MKLYSFLITCALFASGAWCYGRQQYGMGYPGPRLQLRGSASAPRPVWMGPQRAASRPYVMYMAPSKGSVRYSKPLSAVSKYAVPKSPPWKGPTRAPSGPADPLRAAASIVHPLRAEFPFSGGASYTSITGSGPIHTIPAPNLSLARKPIIVAEQSSQQPEYQKHENNNKKPTMVTAYEVTEKFSEPIGASDVYIHSMLLGTLPHSVTFPHHVSLASPELLQLVRNAQQQMPETYGMPIFAQPQVLQPHHQYVPQIHVKNYVQPTLSASPNILHSSILFKPEPAFVQQIQSQEYKIPDKIPGFSLSEYKGPSPESAGQAQIYELDKKEESGDPQKLHYNVVRETNEGSPKVQPFHPSKQVSVFEFIKPNITNDSVPITEKSLDTFVANEVKDNIVEVKKLKDNTVESNRNPNVSETKITKNNTVDMIKPKKNALEEGKLQTDVKKIKENLNEVKKSKDNTIHLESAKRPLVKATTLSNKNKVEDDKKNITEKVKKSNSKHKDNAVFYSQIGDNVDNYVANGFYAALTEAKAAEALTAEATIVNNSTETNNTKVPPELVPYFAQDPLPKSNRTSNDVLKPLHGVPFAKPTTESILESVISKQNETLNTPNDISLANSEAAESTNVPVISTVNESIPLPKFEQEEIVENVTEPPVEKKPITLDLKTDTVDSETTTQVYSNVTVDEKTGEPVIRIYASYKPKNDQKKDETIYSVADTNVGGVKTFSSSNPYYHEDWKSSGGYKTVPGISFGSGINQISEFGLKLRPKLHELETLIGMEK